jgi:hypothetical protein
MRCPNGFKQHPPKSGICVKKSSTKKRSSFASPVTKKTKRCPNGTRKNKAGNCVPHGNKKSPVKKVMSADDAIKKWLAELNDEDFFSAAEIAEIKASAKKNNLSGKEVYDNLDDYAKGTGILVDY